LFKFQYMITENSLMKSAIKKCIRCLSPKKNQSRYKIIEQSLLELQWPKLGREIHAVQTVVDVSNLHLHVENIPLANPLTR